MKLTVNIALTLDGVMQGNGAPDPDDPGFDQGGWQVPYVDDDVLASETRWFEKTDAFLLGRRTCEDLAAHWEGHRLVCLIATRLNTLPKYVASTTLSNLQ